MRGFAIALCCFLSGCGGCGDDAPTQPDAELDIDATADTEAPTTTASHGSGVYRAVPAVVLTSDEPATIYYTVDGSAPTTSSPSGDTEVTVTGLEAGTPLRFFAVDWAGNEEAPQQRTYVVDRLGPPAVTAFAAAPDGDDVDLTWTNPVAPGFADVVVARVTDVSTTLAADGTTYAADDTLGASTIVYVGTGTSFTDAARGPGHHTYLAWARFDTGVYAEGRTAATRIATPAQTCEITIDVTGGTAAVATQPADFTLAVSNYANTAGAITLDVALTSGLAGIAFNPKLVITEVGGTDGAPLVTDEDGLLDTDPYFHYGAKGLASGGTATTEISLDAGGATAITLDCAVLEDPGLYTVNWACPPTGVDGGLADTRTHSVSLGLPAANRHGPTPSRGSMCTPWQSLVLSPDQRYVYGGPRGGRTVVKIDTTTLAVVAGLDVTVTGAAASAGRLALDPSGRRLYAGVNDGAHGGAAGTGNAASSAVTNLVVEIATEDMTEAARVEVGTGGAQHRLRRAELRADGRTMAVTIGGDVDQVTPAGELHFYDVSSWTELDTDGDTSGVQAFDVSAMFAVNVAFDASGRYVVVGNANSGFTTFALIDLEAMTLQSLTSPEGQTKSATWDGDAFWLWTTPQTQLHRLVPSTAAITSLGDPGDVSLSTAKASRRIGELLYINTNSGIEIVNATTGVELTRIPVANHYTHVMSMTQ